MPYPLPVPLHTVPQILEPLTDPLPARASSSSTSSSLLARSEVVIRSKLRRLGSAGPGPRAERVLPPDRPRSLEEVVVQVDTVPVDYSVHQPAGLGTASATAATARVISANRLCELGIGAGGVPGPGAGGGCRRGQSATLPRAAPTPCFYMHAPPPPPPPPSEEAGGGVLVPRRVHSSCGSSRPETDRGGLVCGVPEAEMRSMGVTVCALMVMLSGLAIVYGYFMGY